MVDHRQPSHRSRRSRGRSKLVAIAATIAAGVVAVSVVAHRSTPAVPVARLAAVSSSPGVPVAGTEPSTATISTSAVVTSASPTSVPTTSSRITDPGRHHWSRTGGAHSWQTWLATRSARRESASSALPASPVTPSATPAPSSSPAATQTLYDDPSGAAQTALAQARSSGDTAAASVLSQLDQPTATWLTGSSTDGSRARQITSAAAAVGRVPVLALYNAPHRDCGSYSSGGAPSDAGYLSWVTSIRDGIGNRPAILILEPDAIPQAVSGCAGLSDTQGRYALLAQAVTLLAGPTSRVYLDAGNPGWVSDTAALASALRSSGVTHSAGFALDTASFATTAASTTYGDHLSDALGGAHFVIDTSRNGAGPAGSAPGGPTWCNPPGRRLGHAPTLASGIDRVDALLWIKRPGESDGNCRPGEPSAGTFSLDLARALVG